MHTSTVKAISLLAMLNRAMANWKIEGYTQGCPAPDDIVPSVGGSAGGPDDELWCVGIGSAHNIVATGIEADGMIVTLFSDPRCQHVIIDFDTDGCKVIPSNTVIEAARILPK
ncbi:hypothetical protein GGR51DRAFT_568641 [Nemania sp. FL0031]|nr:hypothetical protein GGR51DRAFT_568641 [Nemania sp. FL0031]